MAPKYLELSTADLEKVNKSRAKREAVQLDSEQMFIAEFGKHYGWGGVQAILSNQIDGQTAAWLLEGAQRVDYGRIHGTAQAVLIGSSTAQAKKPGAEFAKATRELIKISKADI